MEKSQRVRLRDVRLAYRLVGQCRERAGNWHEWSRLLLNGLDNLVRTPAASAGAIFHAAPASLQLLGCLHMGHRLTTAAFLREIAYGGGDFACGNKRRMTITPEMAAGVVPAYPPAGDGNQMKSLIRVADRRINALCLYRPANTPPFDARERRIVRILHDEIGLLISTGKLALATPHGAHQKSLSPRQQQTLDALVDGLSEKEVARRLGVGKTTIHTYVGALYRRFHVQSRAELLCAYWHERNQRSHGVGHLPLMNDRKAGK